MYYLKFEGKKLFNCSPKVTRGLTRSSSYANSNAAEEAVRTSGPSSMPITTKKEAAAASAVADAVPLDCRYSAQLLTAMRSLARVAALAPQLDFSEDVRKQCLILLAGE